MGTSPRNMKDVYVLEGFFGGWYAIGNGFGRQECTDISWRMLDGKQANHPLTRAVAWCSPGLGGVDTMGAEAQTAQRTAM